MAQVLTDREVERGGVDPKDVVTSTAFRVSPDLLGIPLASHPKRIAAILIDLLLVALIANQVGGVILGVLAAIFFFRMALRPWRRGTAPTPKQDVLSTAFRGTVGCMGGVILFVTIVVFIYAGPFSSSASGPSPTTPGVPGMSAVPPGGSAGGSGAAAAPGSAEARAAELGDNPTREELEDFLAQELGEVFRGLWGSGAIEEIPPQVQELIDQEVADAIESAEPPESVEPQDVTPDPVTDPVIQGFQDSLATLQAALAAEERRRTALAAREREARAALAEARSQAEEGPSIRATLANLAEDLGLGFGWGALYFSVFLVWWRGQTPGKKLLRLRVVRLDRGAITWWNALERYGGYAAGFATGLLGFAQVYWDPNRQATHDKISGTVVIQDGKEPLPGFEAP